jgi:hypothetical protein
MTLPVALSVNKPILSWHSLIFHKVTNCALHSSPKETRQTIEHER